jgi:pilus assembly protein CpaB
MKRILPLLLAAIIFAVALVLMRPEPTVPIVTAARDLPTGYQIAEADLQVRPMPKSMAPSGAFNDPSAAIGGTLSIPRAAGDVLFPANLGGEQLILAPDERAVAIKVDDSAGLAGMLAPGDKVGVTAVIFNAGGAGQQGAFSKTISSGLRVLYVSPDFRALEPINAVSEAEATPAQLGVVQTTAERTDSGVVILAVPTDSTAVAYDFSSFGVEIATRLIYITDLLPALDHAQNVKLSLFLEPDDPQDFVTSGIYLPDLVITPGPSPTPTETPPGYVPGQATPTPKP